MLVDAAARGVLHTGMVHVGTVVDDLAKAGRAALPSIDGAGARGASDAVEGALRVMVLGEHANPSTHNIAGALDARGAIAEIVDLADVSRVDGRLLLRDRPFVMPDVAIAYHGAEVPGGGMRTMRDMERAGVTFVNPPKSIKVSRDKWFTADALQGAGVKTPRTVLARSGSEAREAVAELGSPTILKLRIGTEGRGVVKVSNPDEVAPIVDMMAASNRNAVVQEFIRFDGPPSDVRAFVVGDEVVASMKRTVGESVNGDFRTNVSNGGSAVPIELDPADARTAVAASKALGLDVAGVDLMGSPGAYRVIEGNSGPGQKIIDITGIDVADHIAALAIRKGDAARAATSAR